MASTSSSTPDSVLDEVKKALVRQKLNGENIKLWLPPYTTETGEAGEIPQVSTKRLEVLCSLFHSEHEVIGTNISRTYGMVVAMPFLALLLFVLDLTSIEVRLDGNFRGEKAM